MSTEDALFRIIRLQAEAHLLEQRQHRAAIDYDEIARAALDGFRRFIDFGDHAQPLLARLKVCLEDLDRREKDR